MLEVSTLISRSLSNEMLTFFKSGHFTREGLCPPDWAFCCSSCLYNRKSLHFKTSKKYNFCLFQLSPKRGAHFFVSKKFLFCCFVLSPKRGAHFCASKKYFFVCFQLSPKRGADFFSLFLLRLLRDRAWLLGNHSFSTRPKSLQMLRGGPGHFGGTRC